MRVASYARVSSESQEVRGTIGSQLEALRQKMADLGHEIVHEYTDDGYSGARLDRPGLDALRDAAEAGLFEQVWCLTPDRFARSYARAGEIVYRLVPLWLPPHPAGARRAEPIWRCTSPRRSWSVASLTISSPEAIPCDASADASTRTGFPARRARRRGLLRA